MLSRLRIKNFRALRDVELDLKPITILLGRNSSGKSSMLDVLLLLKQTVESRDPYMPLAPRGNRVDLGGYKDFVFGHNVETAIEIELDLLVPRERVAPYRMPTLPLEFFNLRPTELEPHFARDFHGPAMTFPRFVEMKLATKFSYSTDQNRTLLRELRVMGKDADPYLLAVPGPADDSHSVTIRVETPKRSMLITYPAARVRKFYAPAITWVENATVLVRRGPAYRTRRHDLIGATRWQVNGSSDAISSEMENVARQIVHIGPLRDHPHRTYTASGETKADVGLHGETAVEMLYSESLGHGGYAEAADKVREWLSRLDMASALKFPDLSGYAFLFMLENPQTKTVSSIADQGFGVSQILPILVQGFYSDPGTILMLEEPEIHLHPKAQAELAQLLVEVSSRGVKVIAETHSEHLVERLQLLIAKTPTLADRVGLLLFDLDDQGTTVKPLKIDASGKRVDWPKEFAEGFLNSGLRDAIDLQRALQNRSKPGQQP